MKDDCILTLNWDEDASQVTLEGLPEGVAGGASLTPAEGVELIFDCADGQLARVFVAAGETGKPARHRGACLSHAQESARAPHLRCSAASVAPARGSACE